MYYPIKIKQTDSINIYEGATVFSAIQNSIRDHYLKTHTIFILVDENTKHHCLPALISYTPSLQSAHIIEIKSGEDQKSIETATYIWSQLSEYNGGRDSLLINLGGGAITDMGGFVAATYKRGIPYINVPTTLVGMADAAMGGKVAINLKNIKNQVGLFELPRGVYIYSGFLRTIRQVDFLNGIAEMLKYGLIMDFGLWKRIGKLNFTKLLQEPFRDSLWDDLIRRTIKSKSEIIEKDFRDLKERRILNFGHTVGHAFESFTMKEKEEGLSHGHAVAIGMICESYLSTLKTGLKETDMTAIVKVIRSLFPLFPISPDSFGQLIDLMKQDKKNSQGNLMFTLLKTPGKALINQHCSLEMVEKALDFYSHLTH
jgi:3-dehydroquinate synthase